MFKSFFLFIELFLIGTSATLIFHAENYKAASGTGLGALLISSYRKEKAIKQAKALQNQYQQHEQIEANAAKLLTPYEPLSSLSLQKRLGELDSKIQQTVSHATEGFINQNDFSALSQNIQELNQTITQQNDNQKRLEQRIAVIQANEAALNHFIPEIRKFHQGIRTIEFDLVSGAVDSHTLFIDAIKSCKKQLIIVSPWLRTGVFTKEVVQAIQNKLNHGVEIHIGWGWWRDLQRKEKVTGKKRRIPKRKIEPRFFREYRNEMYNALSYLEPLAKNRKENPLHLKLLGTHEKYIIQDNEFALLGSHNFGDPKISEDVDREMGIGLTDKRIIDELIEQYMCAQNLDINA